ncbi:ribonuclease P protein subunit p21 isoform X2 [Falco biarmicus]|uniref:ribonuclease P protein subunit p21 isoform X2 n=1 Tax=Falco rusticolus TaxID=120794 RepID=UPI000FFB91E6|nr:ribonuclease P protein subunit p21 isoform X2 [Falco rusticolus]XP_055553934.1 ribonuclease P protein subunit p21 isoform X2 [Falco cherrug]XP_055648536.1 ribonuclease P protein subunit p21 isoform X2 [Falco peregrinus]XP_056179029.1 ribonuclease P protein subunit p21 isoform X2 [Falco biarmicus]
MGRAGSAQWAGPTRGAMAAPVRDREALQRLSFLFQAAHWVLPHSPALARFYCSTQRGAARRLVLRMAPSVKRAVCRRCCSLLLPGAGGCVRLRGGGQPHIVLHCQSCRRRRRYLCQQKHRPLDQATPTGPAPEDSPA